MRISLRICAILDLNPFDVVFKTGEEPAGVERGKSWAETIPEHNAEKDPSG